MRANFVQILIDGVSRLTAAYGTSREDTRSVCGDADNGFGLLFNWNILGEGLHTAALCVDGLCGESIPFFVNTYGTEFLRGIPPLSITACTNTGNPIPHRHRPGLARKPAELGNCSDPYLRGNPGALCTAGGS